MNQKAEKLETSLEENNWQPTSWQTREAKQQASYPDQAELQATLDELSRLPPLVTSWEILSLKEQIAQAQANLEALTEEQTVAIAAAREKVAKAQAGLEALTEERTTQVASARAKLAQAKASLINLAEGASDEAIAAAQAQVEQARLHLADAQERLDRATLRAPWSGVVSAVHVEVGDTVQPGQPLLDFSEAAALVVEADLPVRLSRSLRPEQPVDVVLQGSGPMQAPVSRIHPVADPRQNTVRIELTLPADSSATPGQYVEIRVPDNAAGVPDQLVIPQSAIVTKGGLPLVFTVDGAGKARLRVVRLGNSPDGRTRVVLSGVNVGDRLIDQPPPGLRAGTQIVQPSTTPETAQNTE